VEQSFSKLKINSNYLRSTISWQWFLHYHFYRSKRNSENWRYNIIRKFPCLQRFLDHAVLDFAFYCKYLGTYITDLLCKASTTGSACLQGTTSLMLHAQVSSEMWIAYCGKRILNEEALHLPMRTKLNFRINENYKDAAFCDFTNIERLYSPCNTVQVAPP
jgi:hypothetical protein